MAPPVLMVLVVTVGIGCGILLDRFVLSPTIPAGADPQFSLIAEVWRTIDDAYIFQENIDPDAMAYSAIDGMVATLGDSQHTRFLRPEVAQRQEELIGGAFEGIGAYIEMLNGRVTIVTPIDGSPAQRAGLKAGDAIVGVDGEDVTGASLAEVSNMVLGPAGTEVTLTILDTETGAAREVTLERAKVNLDLVKWALLPGTDVAYIRISAMSEGATDDLAQTLDEIESSQVDGLILDLRNNPGGLLSEATGVASHFIEDGPLLERREAQGAVMTESVDPGVDAVSESMVVLVNGGTASAAEIVTGALQDRDRATIVGTTTAGAGTVLNPFPMQDGSLLLLAVEEWMTPDGHEIFHIGVVPDETVVLDEGTQPLVLLTQRAITEDELAGSNDAQLLRALQLLRE